MMRPFPLRIVPCALVAAVLAVLGAPSAGASTVSGVTWSAGDAPEVTVLRIEFDGPPPAAHEVVVGPSGIDVVLPGTNAPDGTPPDVRVAVAGGATTLTVVRPGALLRAVRAGQRHLSLDLRSPGGPAAGGDYRLGPGDVVSVAVYEDKSLSGEYTVGQDGSVNLPLVGAVPAIGTTEGELSERIRDALADYLAAPTLSVTILRFESQSVYVNVTGDSPRASKVALRPGMRLADVLSEAGVALFPLQKVRLARTGPDGSRTTRTVTADEVETGTSVTPRDGDVLTVLEPEYVFIRGEVQRPGRWVYRPGTTVQELIAMAGGLAEWADRKEVRILRRAGGEARTEEIEVNLKRVEEGRDDDPVLEPGDLVLVRRRVL